MEPLSPPSGGENNYTNTVVLMISIYSYLLLVDSPSLLTNQSLLVGVKGFTTGVLARQVATNSRFKNLILEEKRLIWC